jgi:hypothetical protein
VHSLKSNSIHLCTLGRQVGWELFPSIIAYRLLHTLLNAMNVIEIINITTFNNGSLGSRIDEERSELRYVM